MTQWPSTLFLALDIIFFDFPVLETLYDQMTLNSPSCSKINIFTLRLPKTPNDPMTKHFISRFFIKKMALSNPRLHKTPNDPMTKHILLSSWYYFLWLSSIRNTLWPDDPKLSSLFQNQNIHLKITQNTKSPKVQALFF